MYGEIGTRISRIRQELPEGVGLVAVSKYHPVEAVQAAYDAGQRIFGESRVQELTAKREVLPADIEWHFIGHLQTNKVKFIAPYAGMIESVDSLRLLREIDRQAMRCQRRIRVLLELHIAEETTKSGLSLDECRALLDGGEWREMHGVEICGLMMMASHVDDTSQIRREMTLAADFFDELKREYFAESPSFAVRSWGMSHDYHIAVECRSTLVRIGTEIFNV